MCSRLILKQWTIFPSPEVWSCIVISKKCYVLFLALKKRLRIKFYLWSKSKLFYICVQTSRDYLRYAVTVKCPPSDEWPWADLFNLFHSHQQAVTFEGVARILTVAVQLRPGFPPRLACFVIYVRGIGNGLQIGNIVLPPLLCIDLPGTWPCYVHEELSTQDITPPLWWHTSSSFRAAGSPPQLFNYLLHSLWDLQRRAPFQIYGILYWKLCGK